MSEEQKQQLLVWTREHFEAGCYLGDIARVDEEELSEEEFFHMSMAYEGFLVEE